MSWNYRVFRRTYPQGEIEYFIHEVYDLPPYDPDEPRVVWDDVGTAEVSDDVTGTVEESSGDGLIDTMSMNEIAPAGYSLEGLRWDLEAMLQALDKPVLEYDDYLGKPMV